MAAVRGFGNVKRIDKLYFKMRRRVHRIQLLRYRLVEVPYQTNRLEVN